MSDERSIWPTEAKLLRLRKEGIVPYSKVAVWCANCVGVAACGVYSIKIFASAARAIFSCSSWDEAFAFISDHYFTLIGALVLPCLASLIGIFLAGLVQTRFLCNPSEVVPSIDRLWVLNRGNFGQVLFSALLEIFTAIILFSVIGVFWYFFQGDLLHLIQEEDQMLITEIRSVASDLAPIMLISLGLAAFFSWLISWIRFMLKHRMTDKEYQADLSERMTEGDIKIS